MARIRSIHPGVFTDEAFVSLSMAARVILFGIWTECDDQGLFEWKPLSLKMRLMPADNVDVGGLLEELAGLNVVKRFSHTGREYGAVRNFRRFQRPKKPNCIHFMPPELRTFVGLTDDSAEPVPHQFGTEGEKSPQMKEKEKEKEEKKKDSPADAGTEKSKYAFDAGIIRLSQKNFDQWKRAFSYLELEAELLARVGWCGDLGPERWFPALSAALSKKNGEVKAQKEAAREPQQFKWRSGIEGVV